MKKSAIILIISLFCFFTACGEELPKYDLVVCDTQKLYDYLSNQYQSDTIVINEDLSQVDFNSYTADKEITSVTIYSENITDESADKAVNFAAEKEIPVIFAFGSVSDEILNKYDKVYNLITDYTHAGEITAEKIENLWDAGNIIDDNGDKIFAFTVVKDAVLNQNLQNFYDSVILNIEIYGVPMQKNSDVDISQITSAEAFNELVLSNEGLIIISSEDNEYISSITPSGAGIEVVTITENSENIYASNSYILNCLVNYADYTQTAKTIVSNCKEMVYPFENIEFSYSEKTVAIPAEV